MSESKKMVWDQTGTKKYETGVSNGALYLMTDEGSYGKGVAWSGLTQVTESPSGAEPTALYADNIKYLNLMSAEEFSATIEAYTYPDEFEACNGSSELVQGVTVGQQDRTKFAFSYKTQIGNDVKSNEYGYKLHIVYGATAAPTEKSYQTINDSPEAMTLSWEISTEPVAVSGMKPTATIVIDSTKADATKLKALEEILYGNDSTDPRLPLPDEIKTLMAPAAKQTINK